MQKSLSRSVAVSSANNSRAVSRNNSRPGSPVPPRQMVAAAATASSSSQHRSQQQHFSSRGNSRSRAGSASSSHSQPRHHHHQHRKQHQQQQQQQMVDTALESDVESCRQTPYPLHLRGANAVNPDQLRDTEVAADSMDSRRSSNNRYMMGGSTTNSITASMAASPASPADGDAPHGVDALSPMFGGGGGGGRSNNNGGGRNVQQQQQQHAVATTSSNSQQPTAVVINSRSHASRSQPAQTLVMPSKPRSHSGRVADDVPLGGDDDHQDENEQQFMQQGGCDGGEEEERESFNVDQDRFAPVRRVEGENEMPQQRPPQPHNKHHHHNHHHHHHHQRRNATPSPVPPQQQQQGDNSAVLENNPHRGAGNNNNNNNNKSASRSLSAYPREPATSRAVSGQQQLKNNASAHRSLQQQQQQQHPANIVNDSSSTAASSRCCSASTTMIGAAAQANGDDMEENEEASNEKMFDDSEVNVAISEANFCGKEITTLVHSFVKTQTNHMKRLLRRGNAAKRRYDQSLAEAEQAHEHTIREIQASAELRVRSLDDICASLRDEVKEKNLSVERIKSDYEASKKVLDATTEQLREAQHHVVNVDKQLLEAQEAADAAEKIATELHAQLIKEQERYRELQRAHIAAATSKVVGNTAAGGGSSQQSQQQSQRSALSAVTNTPSSQQLQNNGQMMSSSSSQQQQQQQHGGMMMACNTAAGARGESLNNSNNTSGVSSSSQQFVFVISGFSGGAKESLLHDIKLLGGAVVSCSPDAPLPPRVTHVVAGSHTPKAVSGMLAPNNRVWVVPAAFVHHSAKTRRWADERSFGGIVSDVDKWKRAFPIVIVPRASERDPGAEEVCRLLSSHGFTLVEESMSMPESSKNKQLSVLYQQMRPQFLDA